MLRHLIGDNELDSLDKHRFLLLIMDGIVFIRTFAKASISKNTLETKVFIQFGPVDAITTQREIVALFLRCLCKVTPLVERIACLPTIGGFSPNV